MRPLPRCGAPAPRLALLVAVVYGPTIGHDFINFDDRMYVTENPAVRGGFTRDGIMRAFGFMAGNWHPLTWLSHMLDVELFGMHSGCSLAR